MSRTHKDRPYWVMQNDPKVPKTVSHDHVVTLYEKVGEEPVIRHREEEDGTFTPYVWYTRNLYKMWTVDVDCTLDMQESPQGRRWKPRGEDNEERLAEKHCRYWLKYHPNGYSGKSWKRATNSALRARVRQELHRARYEDPEDIDIPYNTRYVNGGWW